MSEVAAQTLPGPADPEPVDIVHPDSPAAVVLVCEHAGRAIPHALESLGVGQEIIDSHRGWDIGAADVARRLAAGLGAPLVLQRYSRLVIDCNRPPEAPSSIPESSDRQPIPGNRNLRHGERIARQEAIFKPMDRAIAALFRRHERRAAFSIHSFTPRLDGKDRPWHAGFLTRKSMATAHALMASVRQQAPELRLALNEPYQIADATDWFVPRYPEALGLPHCLIEIRNDQIGQAAGAARWAGLLGQAIGDLMENLA